ncbi:hypothetical protein CLV36_103177 [Laceyella sediminis]|uniref:Uncharacterized protein n=1 Tax=Laceyella sediminis TaxID=573074 RepID=A0ABX5ER05_9BACL|nr:hypothetical protein CLV36_103177 [Laceyella sediminis]
MSKRVYRTTKKLGLLASLRARWLELPITMIYAYNK